MSLDVKALNAAKKDAEKSAEKAGNARTYMGELRKRIDSLKAELRNCIAEGQDTSKISTDLSAANMELAECENVVNSLSIAAGNEKRKVERLLAQGLSDQAMELISSDLIPAVLEIARLVSDEKQAEVCRNIGAHIESPEKYETTDFNNKRIMREEAPGSLRHIAASLVSLAERKGAFISEYQ